MTTETRTPSHPRVPLPAGTSLRASAYVHYVGADRQCVAAPVTGEGPGGLRGVTVPGGPDRPLSAGGVAHWRPGPHGENTQGTWHAPAECRS